MPCDLRAADILGGAGQSPDLLARQLRGKVPALEHDGSDLLEAFESPLRGRGLSGAPAAAEDAHGRARMTPI